MSGFSRIAMSAALIAGFATLAQAQSHSQRVLPGQDRYDALYEEHGDFADRTVGHSGAVPPSESQTVMGLRVPR